MKRFLMFFVVILLSGCATNTINMTVNGNRNEIRCNPSLDKPVNVDALREASVPVSGI